MEVQETLRERLQQQFAPQHMELDNESHMHSVPPDSETHFRLVLVSDAFEGKRAVARHQAVYSLCTDLMAGPLHALAMHLYTESEWATQSGSTPQSPACLGGGSREGAGQS